MHVLGAALLMAAVVSMYLLLCVWPEPTEQSGETWPGEVRFIGIGTFKIRPEHHALFVVIVSAILGSLIHASTSFAYYVAKRRAEASWTWWYLLRVPIGVTLAVIFYFALRAGVLSSGSGVEPVNPFGIATIAGLVGMFSRQATDKLGDVFDTLFKTEKKGKPTTTEITVKTRDGDAAGGS